MVQDGDQRGQEVNLELTTPSHTDLGEKAVFHNSAIQIALIQSSGRSKHAWAFSETVKKNVQTPLIRLAGSHF